MKYSDIKDIASIDAARKDLSAKIDAQRVKLSTCWEDTKESYTPISLTATAIKNLSGVIPFDKLALAAVRALKNKLTEKHEDTVPVAEETSEEQSEQSE